MISVCYIINTVITGGDNERECCELTSQHRLLAHPQPSGFNDLDHPLLTEYKLAIRSIQESLCLHQLLLSLYELHHERGSGGQLLHCQRICCYSN